MSKKRIGVIVLCLVFILSMFSTSILPGAAKAAESPSPDFNGDGVINMKDVVLLASAFNSSRGDGRYVAKYDLNSDGAINMKDVVVIAGVFGKVLPKNTPTPTSTPTSTSTPTPTFTPTKVPPTSTPTPSASPKFHCFLLLGQSNMNGYAEAQASDKVKDPRILSLGFTNDQWAVACPPIHATYLNPVGPGDWFAKTLIEKLPANDTIGLIPCAKSGESIERLANDFYSWTIKRAKLAQQRGGVIEGILFHQGCSNSGQTGWPDKVKAYVANIRKDLGLSDNVPFLAGELAPTGNCKGHNPLVNKLPSMIPNCYVISAQGLKVDPKDTQYNVHFDHDSTVTLGKRYAEKMIDLLGLR